MTRCLLAGLVLFQLTSIAGAECPPGLDAALAGLKTGSHLRLWARHPDSVTCSLLAITDGSLTIFHEGVTSQVECGTIRRLDTRGRSTLIGAAAGGLAGGAIGAVLFAILSNTGEGSDSPGTAAVVGALAWGLPCAGTGALIGAAIPRWTTRYRAPTSEWSSENPDPVGPVLTQREPANSQTSAPLSSDRSPRGDSELWISLGGATHVRGDGRPVGLAGRLAICSPLIHSVRIGAEVGFLKAGPLAYPGDEDGRDDAVMIHHAGVAFELPALSATTEVFVSAGLGGYTGAEISDAYLGYVVGFGARRGGRHGIAVEARMHDNLQRMCDPTPAMFSVLASFVWCW